MPTKKTDTVFRRHLLDRKITVEVTDLIPQRTFLATVYIVGQEVAHRYYTYESPDIADQKRAKNDAIAWLFGAMDAIDGILNCNLFDTTVDWGDEFPKE